MVEAAHRRALLDVVLLGLRGGEDKNKHEQDIEPRRTRPLGVRKNTGA